MHIPKKTVVLGASTNPERYSCKAITKLVAHEHPVIAIGLKAGQVAGVTIQTGFPVVPDVDTVTLYLSAANQKGYYDYILNLHPKRILFNPGTENPELIELAKKNNIKVEEACTLVLLSIDAY
jgi:predicted CoA-binding protein